MPALSSKIKIVWWLVGAALAWAGPTCADERDFTGTVHKIFDGDSFLVRPARGADVNVRLQDIDAPERKQPYGAAARTALIKLIGDRRVFVDVIEPDRYGRKVARVFREGDRLDVAKALVRDGHVWVYRRTIHDRSLIGLEETARAGRLGIWALPATDLVPPWQFRYRQRQKKKPTSVAWRSEGAEAGGFHQPITPITAAVLVPPRGETRSEVGAGRTVVVPQPVEVTDHFHAQR
jgi:endonuclease YncB( thermonuclease family)